MNIRKITLNIPNCSKVQFYYLNLDVRCENQITNKYIKGISKNFSYGHIHSLLLSRRIVDVFRDALTWLGNEKIPASKMMSSIISI